MADAVPDYKVEQQRLRSQIAAQVAAIEQQRLAILEMADRKRRHEENIAAAERAIADYRDKLSQLEHAHGSLTDDDFSRRSASLTTT